MKDLYLFESTKSSMAKHVNPLNRVGAKCFSQNEEDGITLEILQRLGQIDQGIFAEFGVADGTENLTLILIALGWKGFWVGSDNLKYSTPNNQYFTYIKDWVTNPNIIPITQKAMHQLAKLIT